MPKVINAYRGFSATTIKNRATIPASTDMTVNGTTVECIGLNTTAIRNGSSAGVNTIGGLNTAAGVNHWSGFGPTRRTEVGGVLVHDEITPHTAGEFAGYNHNAPSPSFNNNNHLRDVLVESGTDADFTADIIIGEVKYIDSDVINHGNCVGIVLTIWEGANMVSTPVADNDIVSLATLTTFANLTATVHNCTLNKTYTGKIYFTDSLSAFNQNLDNAVFQLTELANFTVHTYIVVSTYLTASGYSGWTLSSPGFNQSDGHVYIGTATRSTGSPGLWIHAYVKDYTGNTVTDDLTLWGLPDFSVPYTANDYLNILDELVWKISNIAKNLPVPPYGYVCWLIFEEV